MLANPLRAIAEWLYYSTGYPFDWVAEDKPPEELLDEVAFVIALEFDTDHATGRKMLDRELAKKEAEDE